MLDNVLPVAELYGVARRKRQSLVYKSVRPALLDEEVKLGWKLVRKNRTTVRISKPKSHSVMLEDRVWTLLHHLGFSHLSGVGGAKLSTGPNNPTTQLDVVALDGEVVVAAECKSSESAQRRPRFSEELAKLGAIRETLARAVRTDFPAEQKRQIVLAMFTSNATLSDNDRLRADEAKITLFTEAELDYYEALVAHLGPATRYQFLSDILPGKEISGLELTLPAVKSRIGGYNCYSFCVSPEYLLKIAYVSHRAKGKASDVDKYQRMIKRARLRSIREYITNDGIFPTNIVVNIADRWLRFDKVKESAVQQASVGWLHIRPAYKVAWVIDGQHRLYAYSGHPRAAKSIIPVMAFSGLPASEQARLFVDINAEQRKVKQNLLQELYAELHWDAEDDEVRARAILSKAIQILDSNPGSPFQGRILKADESRTELRCISLTSMFQALEKTGFYIKRTKQGRVIEYGALWAGKNEHTMNRTVAVMTEWFGAVREGAKEVWDRGSSEGGGLAMNDGVTVCINVLRSVLQHLDETKRRSLLNLDDKELCENIRPFGLALGQYFGSLTAAQMSAFRSLRGVQGQTTGTRRCQQALQAVDSSFKPHGLDDFLDAERLQNTHRAGEIILEIERVIQRTVLEELKREYGESEQDWWFGGVPKQVRKKVDDRINEEGGKGGGREANFDLIDYREIALANWPMFEAIVADGKGNKDARTRWMTEVNDLRKKAMHASKGLHLPITSEQLVWLESRADWLRQRVSGEDDAASTETDAPANASV